MSTATADEKTMLASFPRTNRETGTKEQIRVECGDFNGRLYTHLRLWYSARPTGPGDDGWRPSKVGVTVREGELDALLAAVQEARRLVHAEGRSTSDAGAQTRADRPSTPAPSRRPAPARVPAPIPPEPDEDDLPY